MKVKLKGSSVYFEPITIELVIESEQELCDLWLRMNLGSDSVDKENVVNYLKHKAGDDGKLFMILNLLVEDNKLLK